MDSSRQRAKLRRRQLAVKAGVISLARTLAIAGEEHGIKANALWPHAATVATIRCPDVAIYGNCDPHPADGVRESLTRVALDFA